MNSGKSINLFGMKKRWVIYWTIVSQFDNSFPALLLCKTNIFIQIFLSREVLNETLIKLNF